ncbi:hypothetical protein BC739_006228 [Kutzneria viridogrisea]|uniref:Uncharacterized protein n=1 Tax=Kutzneria viridogrisea TaxID=47990 RepID=A0ABR6BQN0_9PSEU|nr:hypothetical protein [Kutzneria albida]MBA8929010.1 hypothetical protein [Kutzneria viridogrisea]
MTDPLSVLLSSTAAHARQRFERRNGRLGSSTTVHAVHSQQWIGGVLIPAPACHVGTGTWDFTRFEPTNDPVTCGRCLRSGQVRESAAAVSSDQLALDLISP